MKGEQLYLGVQPYQHLDWLWVPPWTQKWATECMPFQLESCHPARCLWDPCSELLSEPQSCVTSPQPHWDPCLPSHGLWDPMCVMLHLPWATGPCNVLYHSGSRLWTTKWVPHHDPEHMHNNLHDEVGCELHSQTTCKETLPNEFETIAFKVQLHQITQVVGLPRTPNSRRSERLHYRVPQNTYFIGTPLCVA